jgi:hypothetical protein
MRLGVLQNSGFFETWAFSLSSSRSNTPTESMSSSSDDEFRNNPDLDTHDGTSTVHTKYEMGFFS